MSERIDGLSPEVLRKQLMNERTAREKLEAEVLALKARIMAGDPPELLVDVAAVILEASHAMTAVTSAAPLGERVSSGKPGSRIPGRDTRPGRAFRRFHGRVESAVNGWYTEKERSFEQEPRDPEELARVWCNRPSCREYQVTKRAYEKSRKLGWILLSPVCGCCESTMTPVVR